MFELSLSLLCVLFLALSIVFYSLRKMIYARFILTALFGVCACVMYFNWGAYNEIESLIKKEKQQAEVAIALKQYKGPSDIIKKMEAHLLEKPNSSKGWFLLGKLYASQGNFKQANTAFSKAYAIDNKTLDIKLHYMQSNYFLNDRQLEGITKGLFDEILKEWPDQLDTLNFGAIDAFDHKNYSKASMYWQKMLLLLPEGSKEKRAILSAIASAQTKAQSEKKLK